MSRVLVIGGAGRVGLPLGCLLARGHDVVLCDRNQDAIRMISFRQAPFKEPGLGPLIRDVPLELASGDPTSDAVAAAKHVVVAIGTPVDGPDKDGLDKLITWLKRNMWHGQHLALRSTVSPGTTARVAKKLPGVVVTYCPERIVEGQAIAELTTLPQLVGATDARGRRLARELFAPLWVRLVPVAPEEAELAKLFANAYRYISFAAANQLFTAAMELGVDYRSVFRAMRQDYPRMAALPRPGFASGPCLYKDTVHLSGALRSFPLGDAAIGINETLPDFLVLRLMEKFRGLKSMTVGILGVAFKADSDDTRNSLAVKLWEALEEQGIDTIACDCHVMGWRLKSEREVLERADLLILGAPHRRYLKLRTRKPIIDIWLRHPKGVLP